VSGKDKPNPDCTYSNLGKEVGAVVDEKNAAYGSSFDEAGDVLRKLYPNGIEPAQYDDMLGVVRIVDKLFRVANRRDAFGESPGRDIAGYGLLMAKRHDELQRGRRPAGRTGRKRRSDSGGAGDSPAQGPGRAS
jgi:hypothetical protein